MPIAMGTTVQSVVINNTVYVGGGDVHNHLDLGKCTVMKLDLQRDEWTKLPVYTAEFFAMTSLTNQLLLAGGADLNGKPTNQIATFDHDTNKWTHPHPPMTIARYASTAVCYNNHIIVAGGSDDQGRISSVEVLDTTSRRWYIAEPLPNPQSELKSTLVGDTLYLMGGRRDCTGPTKVVHKVDLNELITKAVSNQAVSTLWQAIEDVPLKFSAPLSFMGSLLAICGKNDSDVESKSIHLYQPDTRRWVKVEGYSAIALWNCTCSVLPSGEVIVAGGQTGDEYFLTAVSFLSIHQ